ncbi:MAG: response regulator transcription factor [Eubacterium sp.]|nr:response regulator transcription factor [Eubacterium sp.]
MKQILIVEDDEALNRGLCKVLTSEEYSCVPCMNLRSARDQITLALPILVILDINLPDGNGLDFLAECKKKAPQMPVILLTANDTDMDIVQGLEEGADDYITKPFSLSVLRARARTQIRKAGQEEKDVRSSIFVQGKYRFDFENMIFSVDGQNAELSKTEQKLLKILTDHACMTVSRSQLIDRIWTDGAEYVDENALSVTVKRLRDKLDAADEIQTVYGIGYSWVKDHD